VTPKQKAIVAVVAVVVLLMFGALAPKLVPWVIGGFGAFGGLKGWKIDFNFLLNVHSLLYFR